MIKQRNNINNFNTSCMYHGPVSLHDNIRAVMVVYGSWIYNYLCNQVLSPLIASSIPLMAMCTRYNIM